MVALCCTGYTPLPGPLCHGVIDRSVTVHLVGYDRANHAGSGDDNVLNAVIAEKPPPDDGATTDGIPGLTGWAEIRIPKPRVDGLAHDRRPTRAPGPAFRPDRQGHRGTGRVTDLEHSRLSLPAISALTLAAFAVAVWSAFAR